MFYKILKSYDKKIIGSEYPQCIGVSKNHKFLAYNSIENFALEKGKKVDYLPNLNDLKLDPKATLTDFISCALGPGADSIVSSNFLKLLEDFNTSSLQTFSCLLNQKGNCFRYLWLHYLFNLEKAVDYSRSEFTHVDKGLNEKVKSIKSYEEFIKFYDVQDTYGLIKSKKIVLNCEILDFFVIGRFNQNLYVSERLKNQMQRNGITGIKFKKDIDVAYFS